jgi:Protein of unknown function (DUF3572)
LRPKVPVQTARTEDIALKYMVFLASQPEKLEAFCTQSGLTETDLRGRIGEPEFHGFLLDFLLQDESELLAFAAEHGLPPESILVARSKLPGFAP